MANPRKSLSSCVDWTRLLSALGVQLFNATRRGVANAGAATAEAGTGIETLASVVAAHLARALVATRGRVDGPRGAAALLGLHPSTLRAKLRKYGIDSADYREQA